MLSHLHPLGRIEIDRRVGFSLLRGGLAGAGGVQISKGDGHVQIVGCVDEITGRGEVTWGWGVDWGWWVDWGWGVECGWEVDWGGGGGGGVTLFQIYYHIYHISPLVIIITTSASSATRTITNDINCTTTSVSISVATIASISSTSTSSSISCTSTSTSTSTTTTTSASSRQGVLLSTTMTMLLVQSAVVVGEREVGLVGQLHQHTRRLQTKQLSGAGRQAGRQQMKDKARQGNQRGTRANRVKQGER